MRVLLVWLSLLALASACPPDTVYNDAHDMCYKYVPYLTTFYRAEDDCQSQGGHLASIRNGFDNSNLYVTASSLLSHNGGSDFWVGGNTLEEPMWSWIDNSSWGYTNWATNQGTHNFGLCLSSAMSDGLWYDNPCYLTKPYVCALPLVPPTTCPTLAPCPTQKSCPSPATTTPCPACQTQKPTVCPTPAPGKCDAGWTFFADTNFCYRVMLGGDRPTSENNCESMGGYLASIHSSNENNFVHGLVTKGMSTSNDGWIGLMRQGSGWAWADGTKTDYFNWAAGEPNNKGGNENCVEMYADTKNSSGWDRQWNDKPCPTDLSSHVCKKSSRN